MDRKYLKDTEVYQEIDFENEVNKNIDFTKLTIGSNKKIAWKCKDCQHIWITKVSHRTDGSKCPNKQKHQIIKYEDSLQVTHPELVLQWDFEKNKDIITPDKITHGSDLKVYWKCDKCNYNWNTRISHRTSSKTKCKCYQKIKKIIGQQSLFITHPELAKQWYQPSNENLTPKDVTYGSDKEVFWQCSINEDHIFKQRISHRTYMKTSCIYCQKFHKTEYKLQKWLIDNYPQNEITRQKKFEWCRNQQTNRPYLFDFYITDFNLIIELDSLYHFKQVWNWGTIDDVKQKDKLKEDLAIQNNTSVIRLIQDDVWRDLNNWKEQLQKNIQIVQQSQTPLLIKIGKEYQQ